MESTEGLPDSQGLCSHVGLVHNRVGVDDPEGSEEQHEEVLAVQRETGHQLVDGLHLVRLVIHLDDVEYGGLIVRAKDTTRNLPEELLHNTGDGVEGVVLDVDETALQ